MLSPSENLLIYEEELGLVGRKLLGKHGGVSVKGEAQRDDVRRPRTDESLAPVARLQITDPIPGPVKNALALLSAANYTHAR